MHHVPFILVAVLSLARSFPLNGGLQLPTGTQLLNISSLTHHARCDTSKGQSWQAYAFLVEDCFVAVNQFYIEHVVRNPDEIFEFSASAVLAHTRYPRVQTPEIFTYESCTLAIVMLDWFHIGQLPGDYHLRVRNYDTSTSRGLHKAAKLVEAECLANPRRTPGWEPAGEKGNIGVFLWATESWINRQLSARSGY